MIRLFCLPAQGTPMVLCGDEFAQTRGGNNNWYGHDAPWTSFPWDKAAEQEGFFRFYAGARLTLTLCRVPHVLTLPRHALRVCHPLV